MTIAPERPHLKAAETRLAQAVAPFIADLGLNQMSVRAGARVAGFNDAELDLIAPNGAADVAAMLWRSHDDGALGTDAESVAAGMKIRDRIAYLLNTWVDSFAADEALAHRLIGCLMLPSHLDLYRRLLWATADRIWQLAGDKALDENHYSKRTIVCGILATVLMTRLTRGREAQREQIGRNIESVMAFEKFKARLPFKPEEAVLRLAETLGKLRFGNAETGAS
jgi:ubiquinone biosynthesis protein COQ9